MGSTSVPQGEAPQQELSAPATTRRAASPYFSLTTSFTFCMLMFNLLGFSAAENALWLYCFVSRATLGIKKPQQLLQCSAVRCIAQKSALSLYHHQIFVLEFFQMMRKSGIRNFKLFANFPDHHAFRMCRKQQAHNAQPRLCAHRGKHIGVACNVVCFCHISDSIFLQSWKYVNQQALKIHWRRFYESGLK